jgi:hypothetical protein
MTLIGVEKVAAKGIGPGPGQQGGDGHQYRACDELLGAGVSVGRQPGPGPEDFRRHGRLTGRFQGAS